MLITSSVEPQLDESGKALTNIKFQEMAHTDPLAQLNLVVEIFKKQIFKSKIDLNKIGSNIADNYSVKVVKQLFASILYYGEPIQRPCYRLVVGSLELNFICMMKNIDTLKYIITAINNKIDYYKAAEIANNAFKNGTTLKEEAIKSKYISEEDFNKWINPKKMIGK